MLQLTVARRVTVRPTQRVADAYVSGLTRIFLRAFKAMQAEVQLDEVEAGVRAKDIGRIEHATLPIVHSLAIQDALARMFASILEAAGNVTSFDRLRAAAGTKKKVLNLAFDKANPEAVHWAHMHAAELVTDTSQETVAALRRAITRVVSGDIQPKTGARIIRASIGLSENQAVAVSNLIDRMKAHAGSVVQAGSQRVRVPATPSPTFLERQAVAYSNRLLNSRADSIARTETMRAANEGTIQMWGQAQDAGLLARDAQKVWIATEDACPECDEVDGETVGLNDDFSVGEDPPLHPNCRCTVGLI